MGKNTFYSRYLSSQAWKKLRKAARERAGNKCEFCSGPPEHVHHVRYPKRYQDDHIDNLVVACAKCHSKLHGIREETFYGIFLFSGFHLLRRPSEIPNAPAKMCVKVRPDFPEPGDPEEPEIIKDLMLAEGPDYRPHRITREEYIRLFSQDEADFLESYFDNGFLPLTKEDFRRERFVDMAPDDPLITSWCANRYRDAYGHIFQDMLGRRFSFWLDMYAYATNQILFDLINKDYTSIEHFILPSQVYLPCRYFTDTEGEVSQ